MWSKTAPFSHAVAVASCECTNERTRKPFPLQIRLCAEVFRLKTESDAPRPHSTRKQPSTVRVEAQRSASVGARVPRTVCPWHVTHTHVCAFANCARESDEEGVVSRVGAPPKRPVGVRTMKNASEPLDGGLRACKCRMLDLCKDFQAIFPQ